MKDTLEYPKKRHSRGSKKKDTPQYPKKTLEPLKEDTWQYLKRHSAVATKHYINTVMNCIAKPILLMRKKCSQQNLLY